jgi:4-diphosphocytidyl-2C-methyl-D-erythritol kinase
VFRRHPELAKLARKLKRSGADPVRMTGSGSALFGLLPDAAQAREVAEQFQKATPIKFITRQEYRKRWQAALGALDSRKGTKTEEGRTN